MNKLTISLDSPNNKKADGKQYPHFTVGKTDSERKDILTPISVKPVALGESYCTHGQFTCAPAQGGVWGVRMKV